MEENYINSFMFSNAYVKLKCSKNQNNCLNNCDLYVKGNKPKVYSFKLTKDNFISSNLAIATNIDDAWLQLLVNVHNYINSLFIISFKDCVKMHSIASRLLRVYISDDKTYIKLYLKCNIIPNQMDITNNCPYNCIPITTPIPIINQSNQSQINKLNTLQIDDFGYKLHNGDYSDVKFYCNSNYVNNICFINV